MAWPFLTNDTEIIALTTFLPRLWLILIPVCSLWRWPPLWITVFVPLSVFMSCEPRPSPVTPHHVNLKWLTFLLRASIALWVFQCLFILSAECSERSRLVEHSLYWIHGLTFGWLFVCLSVCTHMYRTLSTFKCRSLLWFSQYAIISLFAVNDNWSLEFKPLYFI